MTEIIGVRFKSGGKMYYFNPNGTQVAEGQYVVIETAKGIEFGECVQTNTMVDEHSLVSTLRPMLRVATDEDFRQMEENRSREKRAFELCEQKIAEHKLDMKLVDVQYSFEGNKILFFFTADGRVDFRALVKDLASVFRTRIELRQIGVRDEAKMMGGLGICGRPFCCAQFLNDFQPVSIKMAKTQNISLNPTKISGACGRLMCCLKYEQDAYEDLLKHTPKLESLVNTPDGVGTINQIQLLRQQVKVTLDKEPDAPKYYSTGEVEVLRSGKGRRPAGYELPEGAEAPSAPAGRGPRPAHAAAPRPTPTPASAPEAPECPLELEASADTLPAAAEIQEERGTEENTAERRRRRHRGGRGRGSARPEGGADSAAGQDAFPEAEGPRETASDPSGDGTEHKRRRHRSRRRRPEGGEGTGSTPETPESES